MILAPRLCSLDSHQSTYCPHRRPCSFIPRGIGNVVGGSSQLREIKLRSNATAMKRLFPILFLLTVLPFSAAAQDSSTVQTPAPSDSGYGHGDYGNRAEVFVTGFGLFPHQANGNGITHDGTKAAGGSAGYRFSLNRTSALEGRYGFSRNSQKYTVDSAVSSIPVYLSEISGSYVYKFRSLRRIQMFVEGGGGVLLFSPTNYGDGSNNAGGLSPSIYGDQSSGYVGGSTSNSLGRQAKAMFVYGVGADVPASSHISVRGEFRGLGYKAPDFGLMPLQTNAFSFVYEPSVGIAFHF